MHKLLIASLIIVLAVTSALMVLPQAKALPQVRALTLGTAPQSNNVLASGPPDSGGGIVVATGPENAPLVSPFGVGTILVGQAVSNGKIAFVSDRDGNNEIYTMNVDGTGVARLTVNVASDVSPTWSPDGSKIAFVSNRDGNNEIYTMNADGTGVTRLTTSTSDDSSPAWSPDGSKIAFQTNRDSFSNPEIYVMNVDGSGQTRLTVNTFSDLTPAWSPDGSKIAFSTNRDGNYEIYTMNADGTGATRLTSNPALDANPTWSHDGTKIAYVRGGVGSEQIYVMDEDFCHDAVGTAPTSLSKTASRDLGPAWSPDGTRILFASSRDGNFELYAINPDGTGVTRLTSNTVSDTEPNWQPISVTPLPGISINDVTLAEGGSGTKNFDFTVTRSGDTSITSSVNFATADGTATIANSDYVANSGTPSFAAGETTKTITIVVNGDTTVEPDETFSVNLSNCVGCIITDSHGVGTILVGQAVSNGKIAFVSDRDGNNEIYTMNVDGTGVARLTVNVASDVSPTWSPDGSKIAFVSNRDGNNEIYTMNADGTGATRLTSNPALDANPTWSHDGTKIAFVRGGFGSEQIYVLDADLCHECIGTGPTNLSQSASRNLGPAWSPDGTRILFASSRDGNFELYAINPDGTGVTRLTSNTVSDSEPNWQPISVTPLPGISINDVTLAEGGSGNKNFDFTVTRSGDTSITSSVNFATADGTATIANSDYVANSGTPSFAAGETTKTITIVVNGDTTVEP